MNFGKGSLRFDIIKDKRQNGVIVYKSLVHYVTYTVSDYH